MSNYVVLDAHCDTAAELWKRGETLDHCTTDVSLAAPVQQPWTNCTNSTVRYWPVNL